MVDSKKSLIAESPTHSVVMRKPSKTESCYSERFADQKLQIDPFVTAEIMEDYERNKALIEEYRKSKTMQIETSPTLAPVETILFSMVKPVLNEILYRMHTENGFFKPKSSFNGLDFISEYCYNCNPKYPERKKSWTYIFDMNWVKEYLNEHPRPFYPISLLMSKNTAAKYIQAHLRGYWVRKKSTLQEIRHFWKTIKLQRDTNGRLSMIKSCSANFD